MADEKEKKDSEEQPKETAKNEIVKAEETKVDEQPKEEKKEEPKPQKQPKEKKERKPINFGKGGLVWSIWNFVEAALLAVLGVLCFVYMAKAQNGETDYSSVVSKVLFIFGIFMIVGGSLRILTNFLPVVATSRYEAERKAAVKASMAYDLVIGGSAELALGIALIAIYNAYNGNLMQITEVLTKFISIFVGVAVICAGASLVLFAVAFIISKLYKIYLPILEIIFGAGLIALGIVILYYLSNNADLTSQIALIVLGVVLLLGAIAVIVNTIMEINNARLKKAVKNGDVKLQDTNGNDIIDAEEPKKDDDANKA